MKYLIIDDEPAAIRDLSMVVSDVDPEAVIDTATNTDAAFELCKKDTYDILFLDINMPGKDGITLARELKDIMPMGNIIMVTAYPQYALDALQLYVSGYILKPAMEDDIREALKNLRNPVASRTDGFYARCFGDFEAFYNGQPIRFRRTKTKELLAYLIDRRGSVVTGAQLRAVLWEDESEDGDRLSNYFSQLTRDIKATLEEIGCEDILKIKRNAYSIAPDKISCDLYRALENDPKFFDHYTGEYMNQYSWAEFR